MRLIKKLLLTNDGAGAKRFDSIGCKTYGQENVTFSYEILTDAENRGITRWQASFTHKPAKIQAKFDGIFVVYLNDAKLCTVFEEWWNRVEEPSAPVSSS